jgi:hypothetical protein
MKSVHIMLALLCLAIGSYISYFVTFRLFDSDGNGQLTSEEIEMGIGKLVNPDGHQKKLLSDINGYKARITVLEDELERMKKSCAANHANLMSIVELSGKDKGSKQKKEKVNTAAMMLGQEFDILLGQEIDSDRLKSQKREKGKKDKGKGAADKTKKQDEEKTEPEKVISSTAANNTDTSSAPTAAPTAVMVLFSRSIALSFQIVFFCISFLTHIITHSFLYIYTCWENPD